MEAALVIRVLILGMLWGMTPVVLAAPVTVHLRGQTMGTTWSAQVVAPEARTATWQRGIQAELDRVDGQMSTYRPQSELSRFNRAPADTWQRLSPEFFTVLQHALQLARDSGGAYDPTVGALVQLWGFGPDRHARTTPPAAAIEAARARTGWWRLKLDHAGRRAWQPGGVQVDLSSIAKGYGVDQVGRYLQTAGASGWLVEVGGELKAHGRKADGTPWRVGVERPDAASGEVRSGDELLRSMVLDHRAIATSGDYRQMYMDQGQSWSHHLDPRTGYPVPREVASVSVLASDCVRADPLGTLLSVLGAERGMAYARAHDLPVLMVVRGPHGLEQRMSPALAAVLRP